MTDGRDAREDANRVRLSWPEDAAAPRPRAARVDSGTARPIPDDDLDPAPSDGPEAPSPADVAEIVTTRPLRSDVDELPTPAITRLVDGYERLGSQVLGRMRDLRHDVDADLSEVRAELSSVRTAVEDVADRVQLRQMRSAIDDLRGDVNSLRRAVLEWPELERMAADLAALHSANVELLEVAKRPGATVGDTSPTADPEAFEDLRADIVELRGAVTALRDDVAALRDAVAATTTSGPSGGSDELSDELAELRSEMVALRRRISLKAAGAALTPEDLAAIAEVVTERLLRSIRPA